MLIYFESFLTTFEGKSVFETTWVLEEIISSLQPKRHNHVQLFHSPTLTRTLLGMQSEP